MRITARHFHFCWIVAFAVGATAVVGCGGTGRPKTVALTGLVKIDGKEPGEGGTLYFVPTKAAEGYGKRPANGSFNSQGKYRVMSWTVDDGLVPGHYTVNVIPGDSAKTSIPMKYRSNTTSGLELDVPTDQRTIEYNIEIHSK